MHPKIKTVTKPWRSVKKAFEAWERQRRYLCTYMSHTKLETIDQSLAALRPLASYETWDQFTAECRRC